MSYEINHTTFKELFDKYNSVMVFFCCGAIKDMEESHSLAADVWTTLWEQKPRFKTEGHAKGWLLTSIRNKFLNYIKHKKAQALNYNGYAYLNDFTYNMDDINNEIIKADVIRQIYENMHILSPQQQKIIQLRINGVMGIQIAEELNVSNGNYQNQLQRAAVKLKKHIQYDK